MNNPQQNLNEEEEEDPKITVLNFESQNDNVLDKSFQQMLKPLNLLQQLWFSTRCNIKDNVILPKSTSSTLISLFGTAVFCFGHICHSYAIDEASAEYFSFFIRSTFYFDAFFYCMGYCLNFITLIKYSQSYVQIISKMNKINKVLKDANLIHSARKINWLLIIPVLSTICLVGNFARIFKKSVQLFSMVSIICFDINIYHAARIINLLRKLLNLWIIEVNNFGTDSKTGQVKNRNTVVLKLYFDVMIAYNAFKQTFQIMMLYHIMEPFMHCLVYIQFFVEFSALNPQTYIDTFDYLIAILLWWIKNVLIHTVLCVECELFYIAVRDSDVACLMYLNSGKSSVEERKICKMMLRTRRLKMDVFRTCGLYLAGAQLPLQLLSLIATYTIAILQFAFVK